MEEKLRNLDERSLPGDCQGMSGASAGYVSFLANTGKPERATAEKVSQDNGT